MSIIQSINLRKSYGKTCALNHLSFNIEANKITGLIGRNGAGKTTLLKLIAGHLKPTSGEILVNEQNPFNNLAISTNTILIDETMAFPDTLTLLDLLTEIGKFYSYWSNSLAFGLLNYFSLDPKQRHSRLSKGNRSTFNSIVGISSRCSLTLFDEPTTGMDSATRKDFYRALLKDYIEYPRTILLSSHLLSEVEEILEDILLLNKGNNCLHLPVHEFKEYAVGFRGNSQAVLKITEGKEILYKEEFTKDYLYVVVRRNLVKKELLSLSELTRHPELEILPVSTDDLCVYLTSKTKGGIDSVFKNL